jgi:protein-tyrosine phosphatase
MERLLPFEGGCNFRDVGGYATADGRTVRWGRVFRAGVLSYFTPADSAQLTQLGVRTICDLRRADERAREPTRWPALEATMLSWDDGSNPPAVMGRVGKSRPVDAAAMREAMIDMYRDLPRWIAPRIRGLFDCVSEQRTPVVVHCSAGKDRTGFAVAMLLAALGVDATTIMQDYLYTNEVGNFEEFARRRRAAQLGVADAAHPLTRTPPEIRKVLFAADPEYLGAALRQLDEEFGGVAGYLRESVGLGDAQLERARRALLE